MGEEGRRGWLQRSERQKKKGEKEEGNSLKAAGAEQVGRRRGKWQAGDAKVMESQKYGQRNIDTCTDTNLCVCRGSLAHAGSIQGTSGTDCRGRS